MKLRIKGDSLRLRITPTEMSRLLGTGRIEETIHFGPEINSRLTYGLELADQGAVSVRHEPWRVTVILPTDAASSWAGGEEVGVYGSVAIAAGRLEVAVEKDWACLDKSDGDNKDTFQNPGIGTRC